MLTIPGISVADFNDDNIQLEVRLDIFFNATPTIVYKDDYITNVSVLEELQADSSNLLGDISTNQLTFTLVSEDKRYSPTWAAGPYYGKIKTGIAVNYYIRPVGKVNWIPFGKFVVRDWISDGTTAEVVCVDILQEIALRDIPNIDMKKNITQAAYFNYILGIYGITNIDVDASLTNLLLYGFSNHDKTFDFFNELGHGAFANIFITRLGAFKVKKLEATTSVATITDDDQIISIDTEQTLLKNYNGISLTYAIPQIQKDINVLTITDLPVLTGTKVYNLIKYDTLVCKIGGIAVTSSLDVSVSSYESTNIGILLTLYSPGDIDDVQISVTGDVIKVVEHMLVDDNTDLLNESNIYIQNETLAATYKDILLNYVQCSIPILKITTMGNPLFEIGDTIYVDSDTYDVHMNCIILRAQYDFNGGLDCVLTVLNAEVLAV